MRPTAPAAPRPLYIDGAGKPIFAIFHAAAEPRSPIAVLLCPPFGWEDMCSYRSRRTWAQQLASSGHATLRIDFPGSGDSGGGPRDPKQLESWTDAVAVAAGRLADESDASRIVAVGIGIGGLVAYRATAAGAPVDDLALWAVHARGRSHTRELRAFSAMEAGQAGDRGQRSADVPEGSLGVAGYLLSPQTLAELDATDLTELSLPDANQRRVLLLERDGRAVDERLKGAIEASAAALTVAPGKGYERMVTLEPQYAVPAQAVFDRVATWLQAGEPPTRGRSSSRPSSQPSVAPSAQSPVELSEGFGVGVRETPFACPHPSGDAFGVIAEPAGQRAQMCVVWLNAGPQRHTGPNRMWVEAARRWAARGVPSLRVDLAGIGDADGDPLPLADSRSFYTDAYVAQVRAVLDALEGRGLPARFVLAGLCAGGYWALRTILDDRRVAGAILLNPGALVWDGGLSLAQREARTLAQKAMSLAAWKRVIAGQTTISAHVRTARMLVAGAWRRLRELPSRISSRGARRADTLDRDFDRLLGENRRLAIVFAGQEPLYHRLLAEGRVERLPRWPNVSLQYIDLPEEVHTLRPLWVQQRVHSLIDESLADELARSQGRAATTP